MTRYSYCLLLAGILLLGSCQSMEPLSIDYMLPAGVCFPSTLKRVAVVNNMPSIPDNKSIISQKEPVKDESELARLTNYYNGDAHIATSSLAESLAKENYFDEVVICDSALRSKDITPREGTLSPNEVNELIQSLDVDFLIALENIQMKSVRKINYIRDWGVFYGTVDVKVYPVVKVYLPQRNGPMVTLNGNDSIFWEEAGSEASVRAKLIGEEELIKQASEFAGSIPVNQLLPHWKTARRYIFTGGSVNMRDAAVYAREGDWTEAINLWKQNFENKKGKQKIYSAHNIAVGYEMQDSINNAFEWEQKAQTIARELYKVDEKDTDNISDNNISTYIFLSIYVNELKERKESLMRLNAQMERFNHDF